MKHIKKSLAIILAVIMALSAFSVLPVTVNAAVSDNASVGAETFVCGDFEYQVLSDDTANITKYTGSETDLVLPSELDGHKVDTLYYNSLNGCSAVTSITIPDSITDINLFYFDEFTSLTDFYVDSNNTVYSSNDGILFNKTGTILLRYPIGRTDKSYTTPDYVTSISNRAFDYSGYLEEITITANVKYVYGGAFRNIPTLNSVTIENGVYKINGSAFAYCTALESISIPSSVSYIDNTAFYGCSSFTSINVDSNNNYYSSIDGILYNKNATNLLIYPMSKSDKSFTVPNGVETIDDGAFYNNENIEKVTIPNTVKTIGTDAFSKCSNLKSLILGNSVSRIGDSAFYSCSSLTSVTIPDSVTTLGSRAFYYCSGLEEVSIGKGLTKIENSTFSCCSSLTSITIPDSITTIGKYAFSGCSSLTKIVIPSSITQIDEYVFSGCSSLVDVTIPDSVTSIGNGAFQSCSSLTDITIQDSVTSIGEYAFSWCKALKDVTIPDSVKTIGENVFYFCESLKTVTIPDSVTEIGNGIFAYCSALEEVTIGTGITEIPDFTFGMCSNLTKVTIPDSVTRIGTQVFQFCNKLINLTIPDNVTSIGSKAFQYCEGLISMTIPDGVTEIGESAFEGCTNLNEITIPASVVTIGSNAFYGCKNLTVFGYKDTAAQTYAQNTYLLFLTVPQDGYTLTDSESGISVVGKISDNITLSVEKTDTSDNENILAQYKIDFIAPNDTVVKPYSTVQVSIPCTEQNCKFLSLDDKGTYSFVKAEYVDGCYIINTDTLSTYIISKALSIDEVLNLEGMVSSFEGENINWQSSNTNVARVSSSGILTTINPGVVTVTATDSSGACIAEETFTVAGDEFALPDYALISLDKTDIEYTSSTVSYKEILCEQLNGIYFLKNNKLTFYSLSSKKFRNITTFDGCTNAYSSNDILYVIYKDKVSVYDLLSQSILSEITLTDFTGNAVGADGECRIYVAATSTADTSVNKLFLYSANGELLSQTDTEQKIYNFNGFDSTNGNFYMESYYSFVDNGYTRTGKAITMGNVTNNVIINAETYSSQLTGETPECDLNCIEFACHQNTNNHQDNASLLNNKYLVTSSTYYNRVMIFDSNSDNFNKCLSLPREVSRDNIYYSSYDLSSIGVRAVYNENHDSIILYESGKTLSEYDLETGKKLAAFDAEHNVFNLMKSGDKIIITEKENDEYYIEIVDWSDTEKISVIGEKNQMIVGENQQLSAENGRNYNLIYSWSSSDSSVVSVTGNGKISAWREGKAVVTCTSADGKYSADYVITVTSDIITPDNPVAKLNGTVSDNISDNNYSIYGTVVNSYLYENDDNTLTRVEYLGENGIIVETYSSDCELIDSRKIDAELTKFGGFFSGKDANYFVFGQDNSEESNDCEVIRIVKYSKNWERLGECSFSGANTYEPFHAGSLRMTENDGMLYVYTCHTMYTSGDGNHHQSNMTYVIDEETMIASQYYYGIMNISYGYVSHSFNQFIKSDGNYLYRVDHGDAYPRAVSITRCDVDGSITKAIYTYPLNIQGYTGANATGVSIGGFELSGDNCLIVGNTVDQSSFETYNAYGQRNIFLTVTDKALSGTETIMLTNYTAGDNITPRTPQLVKLNDDQFLIMWEEYNKNNGEIRVKMVNVDGYGNLISGIATDNVRLSDCQPVVTNDGLVKWYTTNGNEVSMCVINPYDLKLIGDVDGDGKINIRDATKIQLYLSEIIELADRKFPMT